MNIPLIILLAILVIGFSILIIIGKGRIRWYKVYLANPEQSEMSVYRTLRDRWWALDAGAFVTFKREDGHKVRINKHWIIKIESQANGDKR